MSKKRMKPVIIEGCRIIFRNFSGAKGKFNAEGMRNFGVLLDPVLAEGLASEGFNVKYLRPREEGDEPQAWIKVKVSYALRPPKVVMIASRGQTALNEDEIHILDWAEIDNVDVKFSGSVYQFEGEEPGVSAYLDSIYVTIIEDALELKYADVPDSAQQSIVEREWNGDDE